MWTAKNRRRYDRSQLRYPSDLTDDEWAHVVPLIPPAKPGGNKRSVDVREVMNGIMYVLSTGCQWRAVPKDVPPRGRRRGSLFSSPRHPLTTCPHHGLLRGINQEWVLRSVFGTFRGSAGVGRRSFKNPRF